MGKPIPEILAENRIIVINSELDPNATSAIISRLLEWSAQNNEQEIQLYVASEAGSFANAITIYDVLMGIPNPISITCIGLVGGFAMLFLAAATKGRRRALKHTLFNFNQPRGYFDSGNNQQTEIEIEARETSLIRSTFEQILSERFEKPIEEIHEMCEKDQEINAFQAVEFGIIDAIMG